MVVDVFPVVLQPDVVLQVVLQDLEVGVGNAVLLSGEAVQMTLQLVMLLDAVHEGELEVDMEVDDAVNVESVEEVDEDVDEESLVALRVLFVC